MQRSYIYGLVDPRYSSVRYVGKTSSSLSRRLAEHNKAARSSSVRLPVHLWLKKLNCTSYPVELESGYWTADELNARERAWIAFFGRDSLLNCTDGGDGGAIRTSECTDEHRSAISEGLRDYWSSLSDDERALRNSNMPAELVRSQQLERYSRAEERQRTSELTRAGMTPDVREKQRAAQYQTRGLEPFSWDRPCIVCGTTFFSKRRSTKACSNCRHKYSWMRRKGEL